MDSPFENIQNDDPADGMSFRVQLLGDTKRGFAKVRKAFVQRTDEDGSRASMLSALVKGKKERAFDGHIDLPERCANLAFGGRARNRLFLAAHSSLYALYVNVRGVR